MTNVRSSGREYEWKPSSAAAGLHHHHNVQGEEARYGAASRNSAPPIPDPNPYIEYVDANGNRASLKGEALTKSQLKERYKGSVRRLTTAYLHPSGYQLPYFFFDAWATPSPKNRMAAVS
jgi:hypothetical protein